MSWQNRALSWYLRTQMKGLSSIDIDVAQVRGRVAKAFWFHPRVPPGWAVEPMPASDTTVAGEWIVPRSAAVMRQSPRTILYLHGGGYFFCSPRTHRGVAGMLARRAMARVCVPDYRLAPEYPAPAALEDALNLYRRLQAAALPGERLFIAGDSAGGGLALALLQALRDGGETMPAGAVLFSPWTDLTLSGTSIEANAQSDVSFHATGLRSAARLYLQTMAADDVRASPLFGAFNGLPPLLIQASSTEMLFDDARRVADKARAAGVDVTLVSPPALPHAWQLFGFLPEARAALREAGDFIRHRAHRLA